MRPLTITEQNNLKTLTENSVETTLLEPTETGLKKSIMDATGSVRYFLSSKNIHDYNVQGQGPENKVQLPAKLLLSDGVLESKVSLYRPNTKKGDPRIWFSKLTKMVSPNEIISLIWFENIIYVINISQVDISTEIEQATPIGQIVRQINSNENEVAKELLGLLRGISAKGPVLSMVDADTSVGRTLETALGIDINSSKQPDYKGIELKSYRANKGNRKNLFAQVPDWKNSKFKSSSEILTNFGYHRDEDFKLYCTVSALNFNSQGLSLNVDVDEQLLKEFSQDKSIGDFVVWQLEKLHQRLLEKHRETFWVAADTVTEDGKDYFLYKSVEHTKSPIVSQFDLLITQGVITLDHLIKRNSKGKVVEKGPLFKIKPNSLDLLFPPSSKYDLINY